MSRHTARRALNKPHVKDAFQRILDEYGLNDERLADKVNQLLEAKTTISVSGNAIDVDDNRVQLEATKVLGGLLGRIGQTPGVGGDAAAEQHVHLHLEAAGVSQGTIMVLDRVMRQIKNPDDEPIDVTPSES